MIDDYSISHNAEPAPDDIALIRSGLSAFNRPFVGDDTFEPLTLFVRDRNDAVVGGLLGGTYRGWLVVDILWIGPGIRHQGWGSRLLKTAENLAMERGCYAAHLDTMSFQAPDFYKRHGYTVFGVLDDPRTGYQRIYLHKRLRGATPSPAAPSGEHDRPPGAP